jgi:TatD DNase family protein
MQYFNLHTHRFTGNVAVFELVNQYPWEFDNLVKYYSIGIHPWYIDKDRLQTDLDFIENKLKDPNCLAIGECGLDKRIEIDFELQKTVFETQLLMAQQYKKAVVVHCVAGFDELIALKKRLQLTIPIVIHGFSKSNQLAKQSIDNSFYLSFGKYLLRNPDLELVFKDIPNDRFFLETDTIEEGIFDVYALASKYKNIELPQLQALIEANFKAVFGIIK